MLGIIGGTGIYSIGKFKEEPMEINTPYGFAQVFFGKIGGTECAFIPRHGKDHRYPPHKINYRANIWALNKLEVEGVLATYACGVIAKHKPGELVIAKDFIGFNASITFFDDFSAGIKHIDFTEPYDKGMIARLRTAAENAGEKLWEDGIVATTHGPRFESPAEIRALKAMGATLVSMTNAYETVLLKEMEISMAALCICTNYAAGIAKKPLSHSEVVDMVARKEKVVNAIIFEFAKLIE